MDICLINANAGSSSRSEGLASRGPVFGARPAELAGGELQSGDQTRESHEPLCQLHDGLVNDDITAFPASSQS